MKKVIGLIGQTGSGKDIFCEYAKKKSKPVFCFRFSAPLTEALNIFVNAIKKEDQQWLAMCLRERFGNNILGKALEKKVREIKKGTIILNGIRAWEEFYMIKKLGGKIVYITADSKIRWERIKKRKEKKDDNSSYKKFLRMEKVKTEALISKIGKKADFIIENNGTINEFYREIKKTIQ